MNQTLQTAIYFQSVYDSPEDDDYHNLYDDNDDDGEVATNTSTVDAGPMNGGTVCGYADMLLSALSRIGTDGEGVTPCYSLAWALDILAILHVASDLFVTIVAEQVRKRDCNGQCFRTYFLYIHFRYGYHFLEYVTLHFCFFRPLKLVNLLLYQMLDDATITTKL